MGVSKKISIAISLRHSPVIFKLVNKYLNKDGKKSLIRSSFIIRILEEQVLSPKDLKLHNFNFFKFNVYLPVVERTKKKFGL